MNVRRGSREPVQTVLLLGLVLLATLLGATHQGLAYTPRPGDTFSYSETISVNNGGGVYSGYSDQTLVSGTEVMNAVNGSIISATYQTSFQYSSNQGSSSTGSSAGSYTWSTANYTYVNGTDDQTGYTPPVYVWFAMNPQTSVGDTFYLLNRQFTVISTDYSFQLPTEGRYVQTIEAEGTGSYQRNDSYGVFAAKYTWKVYLDPTTGYIVGYNYVENDNGQYQGQLGSFTETDNLYVTSASYPLTAGSAPSSSILGNQRVDAGIVVLVLVVIIILLVAATRFRRRRKQLPQHSPPPYTQPPPPPPQPPSTPWQSQVDMGSKPQEQVVIKEVAMVKCRYCGTLIPTTSSTCPYCGAPSPAG